MFVYKRINTTNGKVYIGKTISSLEERWWYTCWEAKHSSTKFARAIKKYGKDSFKTELLYVASNLSELNKMETFFIILHQSHLDGNGYNMTLGGDGGATLTGRKRSDDFRLKVKEATTRFWKTEESNKVRNSCRKAIRARLCRSVFRVCYHCFLPYKPITLNRKARLRNNEQAFCSRECWKNHFKFLRNEKTT